ncbi:zinc finger protein 341-like isoform X2 [Ostrea edulis]|uniref:zinc finger protein 341-like isoform X2 n=1 Tax=Ostrea edulis TaxID=37623 RepID=UPI0024AFBC02|nr:zinc finger protein 341-like isoform X2 [Ostrea edulis]
MNQQFLETYTVPGMDNQTAVAVQSLIDSQVITETTTVDEDDVFQCGKCKKQFCSLSAFLGHKQSRCNGPRTILQQTVSRNNQNVQDIVLTTNCRGAPPDTAAGSRAPHIIQSSIPSYNNVTPQPPIAQNMVLTDELMSFTSIDQSLGNQTLQLGPPVSTGGPYLPQVATYPAQSPNSVTLLGPISSASSLPTGTATYTSATHIQIQPNPPQQTTLVTRGEKSIANTIVKPSPTKAGRKSAQAQANLVTVVASGTENGSVRMRRCKNGGLIMEGEKKRLLCQYCNKAFTKNFDLQQHIRAHTGEKPFQCIVCGRAFAQKSNVKKHMNTHKVWPTGTGKTLPEQPPLEVENVITEPPAQSPKQNNNILDPKEEARTRVLIDNSYICQYCPCRFKSYFHLKSHMVQHKNQQVFKCSMAKCSKVFKELDGFLEHIKEHECEMSYRCHICSKMFVSLYELGLHQYTHSLYPHQGPKTGPRHFQCTRCMNKYSTPEALEHHINTSSHDHPCPHCNKSFTCERYLRRHLPSHGSEGQFQCTTCQKKFKAEHYLKMHALIHTGETPFTCEICNTSFNRKDKLKRHMLIHESSKRYKCPFKAVTGCTKEFSRTDKLKSHIVTHSGLRPFKCAECGRCFSRKPHLIEHERGHRADYKFKCEVCQKGFFRPKLFKEHKCVPSKNGEAPARVYRPKSRRKVGRPRKRMITVESGKDGNKKSDVSIQNVMVMQAESEEGVKGTETQDEAEPSIEISPPKEVEDKERKSMAKTEKPPFCVKVTPPVPRYLTVNMHSQPNSILGHGIQTHFIQTSTSGTGYQNIVSPNTSYQPITIIETQPIPIQVTQLENVALSDQLSLQMTSLQGGVAVNDSNVSVIESVPMQVVMPSEDPDGMVTTHVVVSSSGADQGYHTTQLEDFAGPEGDPVLQGTENLLKAHAEILQSAQ